MDREKKYLPCNIFLIGFMGCGKSTVSRALHDICDAPVIEMDEVLVKREKMSIPDIFSSKGEAYFRRIETNLLTEMQEGKASIVSCGGGVPMRPENVAEMQKSGKIVLLTALPETILNRVKNDDNRPLLKGRKTVQGIEELMEQRRGKYQKAADITVSTDDKSAEQIAGEILELL